EIEKVLTVREEMGPEMGYLVACRVEFRHLLHFAARRSDALNSVLTYGGGEEDYVCAAPRPGVTVWRRIADHCGHAACRCDLLELATGEEGDEATVGRPERVLRAVGVLKRLSG